VVGAEGSETAGGAAACALDGASEVRGGSLTSGGATAAGGWGAGRGGTVNVGRGCWLGTISLGAGAGAWGCGGTGTGGLAAGGGATAGLVSVTGGGTIAGRGGVATAGGAACLARIAFNTSPGFEICDRSILVLISSLSLRAVRAALLALVPSFCAWKWARTLTASCSSIELEWVFFSVTPTMGNTSRMALLLTSSSLARSLIRILLIRPLFPPDCPAKSSYQPHGRSIKIFPGVEQRLQNPADHCSPLPSFDSLATACDSGAGS